METSHIQTQGILKNLNSVLLAAKKRFADEYKEQQVKLNDSFKFAYRNYLISKKWDIEYFDNTSVVISNSGNKIYIANQWFVIASYFVDFCAEMISYRELFVSICKELGHPTLEDIKVYSTKIRSNPSSKDQDDFLYAAKNFLLNNYSDVADDYDKVASYLWKFGSDYSWWSGNKTIERHDFYISPLLNQTNVVNANSEFLAIICMAYASVLKLRILVNEVDNFTIGFEVGSTNTLNEIQPSNVDNEEIFEIPSNIASQGISISAASLQRFKNN